MTENDISSKELTDMDKKTVFISYSWKDGNTYADELETQLKDEFEVKRDKSQLIANDDIHDFMAEIANCDNVIIVLTAEYVKSINCMYEISYLTKQPDWPMKSMVLVIDESLYSWERKLEVLNYWLLREKKVSLQMSDSDVGKQILTDELEQIKKICNSLEGFLEKVSRRKNPSQIAVVNEIKKMAQRDITTEKALISNGETIVMDYLRKHGNKPVSEIYQSTGMSNAATFRILRNLMDKGLVVRESIGKLNIYRVK